MTSPFRTFLNLLPIESPMEEDHYFTCVVDIYETLLLAP